MGRRYEDEPVFDSWESTSPEYLDSPIPHRSYAAQQQLTLDLLTLDTFAERLTYLFDHESTYYVLDGEPIVETDEIARLAADETPGFRSFVARVPLVARWVQARSGLTLTKQALHNFKGGIRENARPQINDALAEFWRIHHKLLYANVAAAEFALPYDETDRRAHELMTEFGGIGVNARSITSYLDGAQEADKQQLLKVLERIARTARHGRPG
ncbi:hypothetical protein H4696_000267 [Amycolatopsis lexingtonensis]|uniref:Uncharacterized protein n=1 Tax=Amycolatopsis lexingtonensis TaxID=218822 RepID=A0ABR9HQF3_9PSEU|nr:hypothetical protein [Amycolatopsis lexingtonensis]MBE1493167.1 hypothetical protein [Amycolatopsis lexingtonensis]